MTTRLGAAFGASMALHAALVVWLASPGVSMPAAQRESPMQVVLLPPNEDATFPGLKPRDPHDAEWKPDPVPQDETFPIADLPRIAGPVPPRRRDCFLYFISGAKERNPAAAMALIERLSR